jgi:hypothetical protein
LVAALAKVDPTGVGSVSAQRKRLEKLLESVRGGNPRVLPRRVSADGAEIREIIDQEAVWTGHAINTAIDFEFVTGGLTRKPGWKRCVGRVHSRRGFGRLVVAPGGRARRSLRRSNAHGRGARRDQRGLIERVRGKAGQPGIMNASRNVSGTARASSVQAAANVGREAMYQKNDDLIASLQWHATLDTRTSKWCIARRAPLFERRRPQSPRTAGRRGLKARANCIGNAGRQAFP